MSNLAEQRAPEASVKGNLRDFPFTHLLVALLDEQSTGTLLLCSAPGVVEARVRFESGVPTAAQLSSATSSSSLLQTLIPLCSLSSFDFVFVPGAAALEGAVVVGAVDPLAVVAAAMRGPMREDAVERLLSQLGDTPLKLAPGVDLDRYGLGSRERLLAELLRQKPLCYSQLRARTELPDLGLRRLVYLLCITRALGAAPLPVRAHSGTILAAPPAMPHASSTPPRPSRPAQQTVQFAPPVADTSGASGVRARVGLSAPPRARLLAGSVSGTAGRYQLSGLALQEGDTQSASFSQRPSHAPHAAGADLRGAPTKASAEQHRRTAEQLLKRNDYDGALLASELALALDSSAANEAYYAWLLYLKHAHSGEVHPEVWVHLKRALKLDPSCDSAYFYKGVLLKQTGRTEEAQLHFRRALKLNPENADARREVRLFDSRKKRSQGFISRMLERDSRPKLSSIPPAQQRSK
jgi:tetratricopeptide (TPR) repeat protein